jgi:hypothetical protein
LTFTKLFSSITESTIWCEDSDTRIVWITMLAMADKKGFVVASIPGLANRARVPIDVVRNAIYKFSSPDPDSSSREFEGRRVESLGGGWRLLNYDRYRAVRDDEDRRAYMRDYMRARRAEDSVNSEVKSVSNVNSCKPQLAEAEAEADTEAEAEKMHTADKILEVESKDFTLRSEIDDHKNSPSHDPIPKVFAFFVERAEKSSRYELTESRRVMAARRWAEQERAERKRGTVPEKVRAAVSETFRNVIEEICASSFHQKNGYVEWEQLFKTEERFVKWIDRYENNFAANQGRQSRA